MAESTTTLTSSENWGRSMICELNPCSALIVPNVNPVLHEGSKVERVPTLVFIVTPKR